MRARTLRSDEPRRFLVVMDVGDEPISELERFARDEGLQGASFTAIGAFSDVVLGYFNPADREYHRIPVNQQVEVLTLAGNIGRTAGGELKVHAHVVVGRPDASTLGGHLLEAHVRPTLEIVVDESAAPFVRRHDPATGLPLLDPGAG